MYSLNELLKMEIQNQITYCKLSEILSPSTLKMVGFSDNTKALDALNDSIRKRNKNYCIYTEISNLMKDYSTEKIVRTICGRRTDFLLNIR